MDNFHATLKLWYRDYCLKINELIESSPTGVNFFATQVLLRIPLFELNNRFVFHRTLAVHIQSKLEFLLFGYDFLTSNNT